MRTARAMTVLALMFLVLTAAYASAQQAAVAGQDVQSLAGKWIGWGIPTSGSNFPVEVTVQPDGSYTSMMGSTIGQGTIKADGGKLTAEGSISGAAAPGAGQGRSELTVSTKDGKQMIEGAGRDQTGPYNFRLTKQ